MNRGKLALILLVALPALAAIKPHYGGSVRIRLNEPSSFSLNTGSYSNTIFSGLIYENFFYLRQNGEIFSNIFQSFHYDPASKILSLVLKNNLSFSNGKAITAKHIGISLRIFLKSDLLAASRLSKILKDVQVQENNSIRLVLLYDTPDILSMLTTPELVVATDNEQSFSGPFYPQEWEKLHYIILVANPFYPGGRTYLDQVRVIFQDDEPPEIFLADPGTLKDKYREWNAGVYQNIYLCFPQPGVGTNSKIALYTLFKKYPESYPGQFQDLQSLTANEDFPFSIEIKPLPKQKMASILNSSEIKLYILSSLANLEANINDFLVKANAKIETIFLDDSQLKSFLSTSTIQYLLINKTFQKKNSIEEDLGRILRESSFTRFNERYLRLLSELEESRFITNEELRRDQLFRIMSAIIKDSFILPLFQKIYSLYVQKSIAGAEVDSYGRPLLQRATLLNE